MKSMPWSMVLCMLVLMTGLTTAVVTGQDSNTPAATPPAAAEPAQPQERATEPAPETQQPAVVEQPVAELLQQQQQQAGPELQQSLKTRVSVDFREAAMEDVIKSLAQQANIDIVKGPSVTGSVTATLTDVPLDEALDSILTVHGFGYATSQSIVRIVPKNELAQYMIKLQTKVYRIAYANIDALSKSLKDMISSQGKIVVNAQSQMLSITDNEDKIKAIDEFITAVDQEIPQVLVEARIYDVSCGANLELGFDWSAGTITLYDATTGLPIAGKTDPYAAGTFSSAITATPKTTSAVRFGILNEHISLDTMFRAAQENVKSRLLANPKVLVLNGGQANIKIVEEFPYQELTQTSGGGSMGTTKFKEIGTELLVTPRIARDGKIMLTIKPSFGARGDTVDIAVPTGLSGSITLPQPIVNKREATTSALIQDGQTVVIGGLRKREVIKKLSEVPLLSAIPLLGELFKFRGDTTVNNELIVFITPHIVTDPSMTESDKRKLDDMNSDLREPAAAKPIVDCGTPECGEDREQ